MVMVSSCSLLSAAARAVSSSPIVLTLNTAPHTTEGRGKRSKMQIRMLFLITMFLWKSGSSCRFSSVTDRKMEFKHEPFYVKFSRCLKFHSQQIRVYLRPR